MDCAYAPFRNRRASHKGFLPIFDNKNMRRMAPSWPRQPVAQLPRHVRCFFNDDSGEFVSEHRRRNDHFLMVAALIDFQIRSTSQSGLDLTRPRLVEGRVK
jgi:hypothetical protein